MRVALLFLPLFTIVSCRNLTPPAADETQKVLGNYEGTLGKGYLRVILNYVNGDIASGYVVHWGVRRNINGRLTSNGANLEFTMKEPGDKSTDGTYSFQLDTAKMAIKGTWTPLHSGSDSPLEVSLTRETNQEGTERGFLEMYRWGQGSENDSTDSEGKGEGTVEFYGGNGCEYEYYSNPDDPTSQLNSVSGNYRRVGDTLKIDWEKNTLTPAQQMDLIIKKVPMNADTPDSMYYLKGNGWVLHQEIAG